jgi:Uma2 family endonuclease
VPSSILLSLLLDWNKQMATVLENPAAELPDADEQDFAPATGESVVLHGVSWKLYRKLRNMSENRNIRMTYDRGELEIMSPSAEHEGIATLIGNLVTMWCMELQIPFRSCRNVTIRRSLLERGFEPDNCYYIQHEPQMWNKKKISFKTDPPPDLAVEVEVTRKLLDKMAIYASFRVPELWAWRGGQLKVYALSTEGEYLPRETSICFPNFPIAKVEEIVRKLCEAHEADLILSFRDWVRANAKPAAN